MSLANLTCYILRLLKNMLLARRYLLYVLENLASQQVLNIAQLLAQLATCITRWQFCLLYNLCTRLIAILLITLRLSIYLEYG